MPFKIVKIIVRGRRLIETVPSSWESDGNLYWPRKNFMSLKKKEKSTPKSDWKCLPCIVLRDNILDYKAAKKHTAQRMEHASNPTENLLLPDSNELFDDDPQTPVTESTEVLQQIGYLIEMVSTVQENQKVLVENQTNTLKALALLNTKVEELVTKSQERVQHEQHEELSGFKTINNIEELTAFEEQIKDPLMETKYIQELSIICSQKKTGLNNAYALVDVMFDRKLMARCSWAGGTKGEPKHCFKVFTKTINLFLKVVHQYDKTFTKPNCEDFLKNIMRHSAKRSIAQRVRVSTTRKKIKKSETINKLQEMAETGPSSDSNQTQ